MKKDLNTIVLLVIMVAAVGFAVSCAQKNVVQNQPETTSQPEVATAPEKPTEVAKPQVVKMSPQPETTEMVFVMENVHFEFDSAILSAEAQALLTGKAEYLRTHQDVVIKVEGHCDERGTDAYNMALGERRANAVKKFLVNLGIDADRLNTISYGEERPLEMGQNEDAWSKNRRAQFVIN
jgi:peptidoglycan-associated lipoprotein